jgi:hypothetical protein
MGLAVTVTFQVACTGADVIDAVPSDDAGSASDGAGAGYPSSSTVYVVSTYATGPTTYTGNETCDTGISGDYNDGSPDGTCTSCMQCTIQGPCSAEWAGCQTGSGEPCDLLFACGEQCAVTCDANANGMIDPGTAEETCDVDCWSGTPTCESDCDSVAMGGNGNGVVDPAEQACVDGCTGGAGTCLGDHPNGVAEYIGALSCSVCINCSANCNAAQYCM